jgi:hypothetical protein
MAGILPSRRSLLVCAVVGSAVAQTASEAAPAGAVVPRHSPSAIVLVLDGITWDDISAARAPALNRIAERGAVGLMNVRTRIGGDRASSCLAIGAGEFATAPAPLDGVEEGGLNADEQAAGGIARDAYRALTGTDPGRASIVVPGVGRIEAASLMQPGTPVIAKLGDALAASGRTVGCVGNADSERAFHREAVLIGMDGAGLLPLGNVGPGMRMRATPDHRVPGGWVTNIPALTAACDELVDIADVLIVDGGDTARVREYAEAMTPRAASAGRRAALERLDPVVGRLAEMTEDRRGRLLMICPVGIESDGLLQTLTPVIAYGWGVRPGLIGSASTRQPGIIAASDLLPTLLAWLQVSPLLPCSGQLIGASTHGDHIAAAVALERRLARIEAERRRAHDPLIIGLVVLLLIGTVALVLGDRAPRALLRAGRLALAGLLGVPLALLVGGIPAGGGTLGLAGAAIVWAVWVAVVAPLCHRRLWVIAAVTSLVIVGDLAFGGRLGAQSALGHSAFIGARYYGLGNEYGGVLLAGLVIAVCASTVGRLPASRLAVWGCAGVFAAVAVVCGQSRLGANLGIALSVAVAGAAVSLRVAGRRFDWRAIAWGLAAVVLLAAVLVALERLGQRGMESHIGRTASAVEGSGRAAVWEVAARKLAVNWKLIQKSIWTYLGVAALMMLLIAAAAYPRPVRLTFEARPWLAPAMVGIGAGSGAALILNDSGVVPAALCLGMGAATLGYYALGHALLRPSRRREG